MYTAVKEYTLMNYIYTEAGFMQEMQNIVLTQAEESLQIQSNKCPAAKTTLHSRLHCLIKYDHRCNPKF